jgi:tRNA nucleotidyltransferase (CCA-adding enzyme)
VPPGEAVVVAGWTHFPHSADVGIAATGATAAEAFRQAALALTAVVTDPTKVRGSTSVPVSCHAADDELLLVAWLNGIVYEMAVRGMVFGDYRVVIKDGTLEGVAIGEAVDVERHEPAVEIKGATLTALQVRFDGHLWHVQCVLDV